MDKIQLRDVTPDDLSIFFEYQQNPDANYMAGFTAKDPSDKAAFMAHWHKILADDAVTLKTIIFEGQVVGYVTCFEMFEQPNVAYWIGKDYWGRGIAKQALSQFLEQVKERPLYARVVKDNIGSRRVLEKCGFVISGEDKGFANARNAEVEEFILTLN